MGIPKSLVDEFPEAARFHDLLEKEARYDSLLAVLRRCVEALSISRGQWVHSVNAERCLSALAATRPWLEGAEGGEAVSDDSGAAFPGLAGENLKAGTHIYNLGLTKREWYAGLAMQAAIAGAYLVHFDIVVRRRQKFIPIHWDAYVKLGRFVIRYPYANAIALVKDEVPGTLQLRR